jgi:ribosomal protein S15P/S13E
MGLMTLYKLNLCSKYYRKENNHEIHGFDSTFKRIMKLMWSQNRRLVEYKEEFGFAYLKFE